MSLILKDLVISSFVILPCITSRTYENRTSGLLEATHLKLTQLK